MPLVPVSLLKVEFQLPVRVRFRSVRVPSLPTDTLTSNYGWMQMTLLQLIKAPLLDKAELPQILTPLDTGQIKVELDITLWFIRTITTTSQNIIRLEWTINQPFSLMVLMTTFYSQMEELILTNGKSLPFLSFMSLMILQIGEES